MNICNAGLAVSSELESCSGVSLCLIVFTRRFVVLEVNLSRRCCISYVELRVWGCGVHIAELHAHDFVLIHIGLLIGRCQLREIRCI